MVDIFEYNIEIKDTYNILKENIGNYWAVVEEFVLPESLVSNKGVFMFKLIEDDETLKDIWILAIPHTKDMLFSFLRGNLSYGEFLKNSRLFVVYWDLNEDEIYIQKAIELSNLKELNEKVENIMDLTITPSDSLNLERVLDYLKRMKKHAFHIPVSYDKIALMIKEIMEYSTSLNSCLYQESNKLEIGIDLQGKGFNHIDSLSLAA